LNDRSGIDVSSVRLTVQGQEYTGNSAVLSYDAQEEQLLFDPVAARLPLQDGQTVEVTLTTAWDTVGNAIPQPFAWSWVYEQGRTFVLE
jgi:hypothetical protein